MFRRGRDIVHIPRTLGDGSRKGFANFGGHRIINRESNSQNWNVRENSSLSGVKNHKWTNSAIGFMVLLAYLTSILLPALLRSNSLLDTWIICVRSETSMLTHSMLALVCSIVNIATHSAVVLNVLEDAMVVSILIGVGFDIISELIYILLWIRVIAAHSGLFFVDLANVERTLTCSFLLVYIPTAAYIITMHIRALRMAKNFDRLESVVQSAYNNLIGDPGSSYIDHLFAFVDLGQHVFHFLISAIFVGKHRAVIVSLALFAFAFWVYGMFLRLFDSKPSKKGDGQFKTLDRLKDQIENRGGKPLCKCSVCSQQNQCAFHVDMKHGSLCELWFLSFRQLLEIIEKVRQTPMKKKRPHTNSYH